MRSSAVLALVFAACRPLEYAYHADERVDVFEQNRQRAIDVLLVVDNSCSMTGEQEHLARSFDALIASLEAGDSDWRVAATTSEPSLPEYRARLSGGTDEIVLRSPDGFRIDRVAYDDRDWPIAPGAVLERCDPTLAGDDPEAWSLVDGRSACVSAPPTGADLGPRVPEAGELVVRAFLPWPADGCAWLDLENRTPDTLDLGGLRIEDEGRDRATLPPGTRIAPGAELRVGRSEDCGDVVFDGSFHFAGSERWIDPTTRDADEVFSELVAVGTAGFGLEMGMENALLALTHPENRAKNGGFLRDDADLALLFFSDEDDLSPDPVDAYIDAFRRLEGDAGYREPDRVRFGAAVGLDASCADAAVATRYLALVERTGGRAWSICDDLSLVADEAGVTFSEQLLMFELSGLPDLDTLLVEEWGSDGDDDYVGSMELGPDFVLEQPGGVVDAVRMVFPEDRVPPGHLVTVRYVALPDTATLDLGAEP